MKVFLVQESAYHESEEVLGVFSTAALAEAFAREQVPAPRRPDVEKLVIIEAEIDKPIDLSAGFRYIHGHAIAEVVIDTETGEVLSYVEPTS